MIQINFERVFQFPAMEVDLRDGRRRLCLEIARTFDYENRLSRERLVAHSGDAMFAAFSPDGSTLVSAGTEGTRVQFWNLKTGEPTVWFAGDEIHIHNVSFAPNGKMVAAVQWDGTARIWKVE